MRRGVKEIIQKVGITSILVTHDREEAFDIADKVVVFNRSEVPTTSYKATQLVVSGVLWIQCS